MFSDFNKCQCKGFWFASVSQITDGMPVAPPVGDTAPLDQFASTPTDTGLTSLMSVCPSSEPEKVNHENDLQNEMKLQKLDDQILQLLSEVSIFPAFLSSVFVAERDQENGQKIAYKLTNQKQSIFLALVCMFIFFLYSWIVL